MSCPFRTLLSFQLSICSDSNSTDKQFCLRLNREISLREIKMQLRLMAQPRKDGAKLRSMGSSSMCKYGHGDDYDDEDLDISTWAMGVVEAILEKAFRPPPKVSFMDRYLHHQSILLETDVDEAGDATETLKEDLFPGNPNPPLTFSLKGTISAEKKRPPKGWSIWDSTLEKEQQLYVTTDSLNKLLMEQYWQQGRSLPVFRDERVKCKTYPMFVRDDVSKQEMRLNFDQEIE